MILVLILMFACIQLEDLLDILQICFSAFQQVRVPILQPVSCSGLKCPKERGQIYASGSLVLVIVSDQMLLCPGVSAGDDALPSDGSEEGQSGTNLLLSSCLCCDFSSQAITGGLWRAN